MANVNIYIYIHTKINKIGRFLRDMLKNYKHSEIANLYIS